MSIISSNPANDTLRKGMIPILLVKTLRLIEKTLFGQSPINGEDWIQVRLSKCPLSVTLGYLTSPLQASVPLIKWGEKQCSLCRTVSQELSTVAHRFSSFLLLSLPPSQCWTAFLPSASSCENYCGPIKLERTLTNATTGQSHLLTLRGTKAQRG